MENVRGVNLGGWLVLERWISPSVFQGTSATDEYTLCLELGHEEAERRLQAHRKAFITEEHIARIAQLGMNTVRLPVGYWLFGGEEPFVDGGEEYVTQLFGWVHRHGVKVILDFHAASGSQNGWDHSGRAGALGWHRDQAHIDKSLEFLGRLCERYGMDDALIGIEPLNEPHWDVPIDILVDYYERAADIIRGRCKPDVKIIVSDAFRWKEMSKALRRRSADFVIDIHLYQLFTPEDRALDLQGHLDKVDGQWRSELRRLKKHHDVLVGEWSAAMTELYDPTIGTQRSYESADYQTYFRSQRDLFEELGVGRTYWTSRTENAGPWSLLDHTEYL